MPPRYSYSQRFEDLYLDLCFGDQPRGFYIDIGAGHPVYDNVSFGSYLKGWRGVCVEPNPKLAQLGRAVRPRDTMIEALVGTQTGEASFHLVEEFHGLSTMIEAHAREAQTRFGKASRTLTRPVTTLMEICRHAPTSFEFLKIDVEGAEGDVIAGGDWRTFRPKVIVIEALAPYTLAPAWDAWEPLLAAHGYAYAHFDSLNRYYVAGEEGAILARLKSAPERFDQVVQFRDLKAARADAAHPDHRLATLLSDLDPVALPLLDAPLVADALAAQLAPGVLDRAATPDDAARIQHLIGRPETALPSLDLPPAATVRDLCLHMVESEAFRATCGRISASSAW